MWLKLFFLLLYFTLLFLLARFFEAVVWYETGMFATQLVDPVTLSYKRLKTILECRGLRYSSLAEKKDVSELVEKSGKNRLKSAGESCLLKLYLASALKSLQQVMMNEL
ncbi:hypothetical protein AMECASPLE_024889 [Ameca splendens]|uniref:Uncharacterized protein n=1 Tax=Ameca splendens TaxID=208324 RepID=A0ABV1AE26_9TELE